MCSPFCPRLCTHPGLSTTIAHIDRQQFGHEDKRCIFLYAAATPLVQQRQEERQATELANIFTLPSKQQGAAMAAVAEQKTLRCFRIRDGATYEPGEKCQYSHSPQVVEVAKKAKQRKGNGGGKGQGKGKGNGKSKRICNFINKWGCQRSSACTFLHETFAMAAEMQEGAAPTQTYDGRDCVWRRTMGRWSGDGGDGGGGTAKGRRDLV